MALSETAKLIAELGFKDKLTGPVNKAIGGVDKLEKRMARIGGHLERGIGKAAQNVERGAILGVTAAAGALTYAVKQAVDAESAIAGVAKTVNGDISAVTDGLKTLSNTIPVSFGELAGIAELGGAMGIAKKDLVEFTRQVAILGTTTNVSVEDAATALGQMANVIGLTGKEFDNFAAALVDLGNKGASTEAQILEIARRSGGAAHLIGVAKDATLGWASAAANLGLNEELAGTALQRFFVLSQTLVTGGGADLAKFAKISGKTAAQFKKAFAKDATGALTDFLEGLGEMSKGRRIKAVQDLFGKGTGLTRLILGLSDSIDKNLTPSLETSATAWDKATAAQVEADKRFATSSSQFKILKNNIDNAAATIGANLLPVLTELSREGVAWLADPKVQAGIKAFGQDLATGARDAVKWLKSLDWNAIAGSLKAAAGFGKGLVDAFLAAPPWLQQFLAAGFVANKFTGGALSGIIGELGKGLIKGVLGMNAGVVNINAGVVNGGGGGLPGAAGAGAGIAGRVTGLVGITGFLVAIEEAVRAGIEYGAKNTDLGSKGLNAAEIAAVKYYQSSIAEQQYASKRLGYVPTRADFLSGTEKLKASVDTTTTRVEGMRGLLGAKLDKVATNTIAAGVAAKNAGSNVSAAARAAGIAAAVAAKNAGERARGGGLQSAAAIRAKRLSVTVNTRSVVNLSGREWLAQATQTNIRGGAS